jgi:hypothetical protein
MLGVGVLTDRGAEDWSAILPADQVGLLLRATFINPFKPVVDRDDRPVRPYRSEERMAGNSVYPGVDQRGMIHYTVRPPSPAHHIGSQKLTFLVKEGELSGRRGVVELERLVACIVDQCIGNAERRDKVMNASVLGKTSAHGWSPPVVLSA